MQARTALAGASVLALCPVVALQVTGQEVPENGAPSGAYEVMPVFPRERVTTPPAARETRRALVINPDGSLQNPEPGTPEGEATSPAGIPRAVPILPQPGAEVQNFLPGRNGMDGMPIDPSRPVRVEIIAPTTSQVLQTQTVDVFFNLQNYKLGEEDSGGNRVHYILNNNPPQPVYDEIQPITYKNLSEGGHTVRVFAVRPDGTMFSNPEAYDMVHFYLRRKDFQNYTDPDQPYLTVNLPTEELVSTDEQGRIVFDYRIHHFEAEPGLELRYKIGAFEGFLTRQGPVYWSNLATGKHKLEVELLRPNRQPAIGPFNRVEREFSVVKVRRAEPVTEEDEALEPIE